MKAATSVSGSQSEVTMGQMIWQMRVGKAAHKSQESRTPQNLNTNRNLWEKLEHIKPN